MLSIFYDRTGIPSVYAEDGVHLFAFNGHAVGYIEKDSVYAYNGRHLGWIEDGWIRDHVGEGVFFTDEATGGPEKPVRATVPPRKVKHVKPTKQVRQLRPVKAMKTRTWSHTTGEIFFR
jgi:hypothetical protein